MIEHNFLRTTCGCTQCVACCKRQPGPLIPGDLEKIAAFRGETMEEAKKNFWASPGSLVKHLLTDKTERIGTITPRWDRRNKRCVFLTDDDRCSIHPVAPFGCSHFDTHMNFDQAHPRSLFVATVTSDPEYQKLRNELPMATHYKPRRYK